MTQYNGRYRRAVHVTTAIDDALQGIAERYRNPIPDPTPATRAIKHSDGTTEIVRIQRPWLDKE